MAAPLIDEDEQYDSSEDSDFQLGAQPAQGSEDSESESDAEGTDRPAKRRRTKDAEQEDVADYENSGDEAIIKKGAKREKKRKDKDGADADDDEGGEGGLIKTRRQRAQEFVMPNSLREDFV